MAAACNRQRPLQTAVIISHRVGLCRLADKVVFLKDGQVKGIGSHQHLLQSCEEYSHFYTEQAKWHATPPISFNEKTDSNT